ncbi:MAG: alpha/beta hydrolase-fold protein [Terrimicrobiaceae bacterium]
MSQIRFEVLPPIRDPQEPVFICGSLPALGSWDPAKALPLQWAKPHHAGEITVETGTSFEYKILRGSWQNEAVDAWGHVLPNFRHDTWLNSTRHHTVADWKDRYAGRLTRDGLHSNLLAGPRELLVWLPPSYASEPERHFPLILLHDGANVFDPATSFTGVDWAADEWVTALHAEGVMPEALVVAIVHPEGYNEDGQSFRDVDLSPELGGSGYARFLVTELLPYLDGRYRTLTDPAARILAGASLGALLTFYVSLHHPGVFGKFACLSTSFEDVSQSLPQHSGQLQALEWMTALPAGVRMYFDYGDTGLDECYEVYHTHLASLLRSKGWTDQFTTKQIAGGTHNELSWRNRFGTALRFLAS